MALIAQSMKYITQLNFEFVVATHYQHFDLNGNSIQKFGIKLTFQRYFAFVSWYQCIMSELPYHLSELPHQNNSNIVNDNNFFFQNFHFICFKIILYTYTIKTLKYISLSKEKHIFLTVLIQKKKIHILKQVKF